MKPRWTETSPRVGKLMEKAKELDTRIEKAGWENAPTEGSKIGGANLEIETGGRIAQRPQYWTNQSLIEVEDVTNKGASPVAKDPTKMMDAPPPHYGPNGSTLDLHESGSDTTTDALKKSEDVVLGSLHNGDNFRLRKIAETTEDLARRL